MKHHFIFISFALVLYPLIGVVTGLTVSLPGYFFGVLIGYAATSMYVATSDKWKYIKRR